MARSGKLFLADLVLVTNPTGHIGLIGVYFPQDPG